MKESSTTTCEIDYDVFPFNTADRYHTDMESIYWHRTEGSTAIRKPPTLRQQETWYEFRSTVSQSSGIATDDEWVAVVWWERRENNGQLPSVASCIDYTAPLNGRASVFSYYICRKLIALLVIMTDGDQWSLFTRCLHSEWLSSPPS